MFQQRWEDVVGDDDGSERRREDGGASRRGRGRTTHGKGCDVPGSDGEGFGSSGGSGYPFTVETAGAFFVGPARELPSHGRLNMVYI
ncbi:hypothetical protein Lalb_Chr18g0044751 [Lupinus albus]|uniref:Uncharacterized protein n=1 Tax=Lupinus albus TaxID=3870 RepID=A0A6A4NIV1_LUPAL|nr:hypothetical protein Lalb_Chr18g0044751 [Lupinus albus]